MACIKNALIYKNFCRFSRSKKLLSEGTIYQCCIPLERKFSPLSESGIRFSVALLQTAEISVSAEVWHNCTPQTFFLCAICLREQVLKAAKAEESTEFDRKGVQEVFLKTVRTGMKDNNVKSQIEPLVKRTSTSSDDDIIKELNLIVSEEEIRRKKLEEEMKRKTASVNETHLTSAGQNLDTHSSTQNSAVMNPVQNTMQNPAVMNSMQNPAGMSPFMDVVKELRDEVKCLRVEVNDLREKSERGAPANKTKKSWGCDYCKKNQKGHLCRHCFRCGAGDHKIQDCPQPREHPLNH